MGKMRKIWTKEMKKSRRDKDKEISGEEGLIM